MYHEENNHKAERDQQRLEAINAGLMPFGKHEGKEIKTLPLSYVRFLVESRTNDGGSVSRALFSKFEEIHPEAFTPLPVPTGRHVSDWECDKKYTFEAILIAKFSYMARRGMVDVTKLVKNTGELLVHNGQRPKELAEAKEGQRLKFSGTVKAFNVYKDENQTLIKNLKVLGGGVVKASDQAKRAGYKSLLHLAQLSGRSPQSLSYTAKLKPDVFRQILEDNKPTEPELSLEDTLKLHGYKSLAELSRLSDWSAKTLKDWYSKRPDLFRALLEMHKTQKPEGLIR